MRRWLVIAGAALAAAGLVYALWVAVAARGPRAIVLIVVDTLRPDRLSAYGYTGHETPNIDALAARGTTFENAHAVASWTVPSMGAMLTSRYPMQLGLVETPAPADTSFAWRDRRPQRRLTPDHSALMLAETLEEAGYATAAFVNQPGLNVGDGFLQGIDEWYYPKTPDTIVRHDTAAPLPYEPWAPSLTAAFEIDGRLVDRFAGWLAQHAHERTFAWVHLLTPHRPYNPVAAFTPRGDDPSARYDAEIRATDELIGRVLSAIERSVGFERALIVFVSDHGEAFGEHGMEEHGHTLHAEVVRVPLIVAGDRFPAGARVPEIVRTIDIAPTVLDVAERPVPPVYEGMSLRAWLARGRPPLRVYGEGMLYGSTERMLIDGGIKLMTDTQAPPALYAIETDPDELRNLAADRAAAARALAAALDSLHAAHAQTLEEELGPASRERESEAARRALRSLGYIR